jgi:hypothetical protein
MHKASACSNGVLAYQLQKESRKGEFMIDLGQPLVPGNDLERRERTRVTLRLQCRVERPGHPARRAWKSVENISRGGMLIRWGRGEEAPPTVGEILFVKLKLPTNPLFGQRWMLFNASVVRVTQAADAKSAMVAVSGSPIKFTPSLKRAAGSMLAQDAAGEELEEC